MESQKRRAAAASLATNLALSLLKLAAAFLTGSISLFSELVHSLTDIVASILTLLSVRAAAAPPDDQHPYGHGKIESLAGFLESILLGFIVVYILSEAVPRILHPVPLGAPMLGVGVMLMSGLGSFVAGRYVLNVGSRSESDALQSNGRHLMIDSVTSAGVLIAILVSWISGLKIADPLMACAIAAWIAFNAWQIGRYSFNQLIDQRITDSDLQAVLSILQNDSGVISFHRLLTRHSGSHHYVQVHVVVPRTYTVVEGHEIADRLEKSIAAALAPAHVVIHVDPLEPRKIAGIGSTGNAE